MIEIVSSLSGEEIYKIDGRLLASRNNPREESKKWVERYRNKIRGSKTAIVLGAGCGFHIDELHKEFSSLQIYVFDPRSDLLDRVKARFGLSLCDVQFLSDVRAIPHRAICSTFIILKHSPSWQDCEAYFSDATKFLSGRYDEGFEFQKNMRPGLQEIRALREVSSSPLSINDLLSFAEQSSIEEVERSYLYALKELLR